MVAEAAHGNRPRPRRNSSRRTHHVYLIILVRIEGSHYERDNTMNRSSTVAESSNAPAEAQVGVLHPAEAYEQEPNAPPVTRLHDIVDGDRDEEVTILSSWAGASSEDPASGGIPSAETQHHQWSEGSRQKGDTPAADHVVPMSQDLKP